MHRFESCQGRQAPTGTPLGAPLSDVIDPTAGYARGQWQPVAGTSPADRDGPVLLIGTRKGAWIVAGDESRGGWSIAGPMFLGHVVQHLVLDPRDRTTLLMAAKTGHLGPTVFRSTDLGRSWHEAVRPPAFAAADETRQSLSATRLGSIWDVALDALGAGITVGLLLWIRIALPRLADWLGLSDSPIEHRETTPPPDTTGLVK